MNKIPKVLLGTFASFALAVPFFVSAQEIEEVVVTATKKAESVQDLALSIEAFTAEDMEKNLIKDAADLQEVVPGLIADKGIGSGVSYAIRGTGSYGVGAAVVGAVVTSMNGHSVGTGAFYDLGFYDVERIEVLKGPQGTLFGRNAVNGVINVISARPTSEFEGKVDITYGDYNTEELTAVINMPISDTIRTRLAVTSSKRDGFTQNVRDGSYFNDKDAMGARLSIDFDIGEVGKPQSIDWYEGCKLETIAFGHGITTTILQLAKGYSIITNGGYDIKPSLVDKTSETKEKKSRLINKGVSDQVVKALRKIVNTKEGTAKFADVSNYEIGGKTGTADQPKEGSYSEAKINTFASIFPTSNPQYVFVVMLDTPQKAKDYYYKYRHQKGGWKGTLYNTAGWTSVEVAGKIMDKIGPILATKYLEIN